MNNTRNIIVKKIEGKIIPVNYDVRLEKQGNLIYQVVYLDKYGKIVNTNIGQTQDKDNGLKRPMRHITDNADKSTKWLVKNLDKITDIRINILMLLPQDLASTEVKSQLTKYEGLLNYKSHIINKVPTLNQFHYRGELYCTNGLLLQQ